MESRKRRLLSKEDSCSGMDQPEKAPTVGKETRAVQGIPSAHEVVETILHALGCYGKYT